MKLYSFLVFILLLGLISSCGKADKSGVDNQEQSGSSPNAKMTDVPVAADSTIDVENINSSFLIELIENRINELRKANDKELLKPNSHLSWMAQNLNDVQTLTGQLGTTIEVSQKAVDLRRINNLKGSFKIVGENVQHYPFLVQLLERKITVLGPEYQKAANDIVQKWSNKKVDNANMLSDLFSNFGTGVAWNNDVKALYVTQLYGQE